MSVLRNDSLPPPRRGEPLQRLLFGGVYGSVLASALAAALGHEGNPADPGYDALWVALSAVASAAAHGYAHSIAHRTDEDSQVTAGAVRSMLTEWPLVAAMVPTIAVLLGAQAKWWGEASAIDVALGFNMVALFGWGVWAARVAGRPWAGSFRVGGVDVMIGLFIVVANVLSK
ncbi:hypothetical protein RM550_02210 [Streptomyces sp. DSM 41527]|uniref:DUF1761 domain-containing protein n=1 Tax=Streptomyces mooreae TaxID=3075523 RepID=A0ABU2SZZ5_9ACTN|nr:hypothetical protein [Streptomyces sp. DSM 41527]MDT0454551.1 hypothetical protein [Streptomyces sp. DSM 41527]